MLSDFFIYRIIYNRTASSDAMVSALCTLPKATKTPPQISIAPARSLKTTPRAFSASPEHQDLLRFAGLAGGQRPWHLLVSSSVDFNKRVWACLFFVQPYFISYWDCFPLCLCGRYVSFLYSWIVM